MNPVFENQLLPFVDYFLERNRTQDCCFGSLFIILGGSPQKLEDYAKEKGITKNTFLPEEACEDYAIQGYLGLKTKHVSKIHGCFVHWVLSKNRLLEVFAQYRNIFSKKNPEIKWRLNYSDRLSDLLIDTHLTFPIERLNDPLLTLEGRAFLFHQLIAKKQNLLAKRLFTSDLLEARFNKGCTPLMTAAKTGNEEMLTFLIAKGADLEAQGKKGKTALLYAIKNKFSKGFHYLRANGANLYHKNHNKISVLHYAIMNNDIPLVKELLNNKKFDINEKTASGNCILRYALKSQTEIIDLILKDPRYKKTPFTSGGDYVDGGEIQGVKHPRFVPFSTLMRLLCLRYGITHTFKMTDIEVSYGSMFMAQVLEDIYQSVEEYIKGLDGTEKASWEKALEIVKWGNAHKHDLEKTSSQAPYGIIAYVAILSYSSISRHAISIVISKNALECFVGNRNLPPYGIQQFSSISLTKMVSYVKKTNGKKYRSFERLFSQTKSKFNSYSPKIIPHKIQVAPNCTVIAAKLNFESVLLALPESTQEARNYYKKFSHFDRLRTLRKVLTTIKEINRISEEMNIFREQLVEEGIIIEPVLEKIFYKSIKKGDLDTLKLLLPLSPFRRDCDLYILQAYIHNQEDVFRLFFRPTPLSRLLDSLDFKDSTVRDFVKENVDKFLRIEDPFVLIELYIKAFNKKIVIPQLKEQVLKINDLEGKLLRIVNAITYSKDIKRYSDTDKTIIKLYESLGLSRNSLLFSFYS